MALGLLFDYFIRLIKRSSIGPDTGAGSQPHMKGLMSKMESPHKGGGGGGGGVTSERCALEPLSPPVLEVAPSEKKGLMFWGRVRVGFKSRALSRMKRDERDGVSRGPTQGL